MSHHIETIIIGAGQAGLATSYHLTQHGLEHLVLEQAARPANAWRTGRWDSFSLVTPNWSILLPGAEYRGPDPDGFMPCDEFVAYLERYAAQYNMPVRYNTRVLSVEPHPQGAGYCVRTEQETLEAANVVVATGLFHRPNVPAFSAALPPDILQLHSGEYRRPDALPPGAVLVVGSAQSGCQIAEELHQSGRHVYLCTGGAGRAPRRYRGRDLVDWLAKTGFFDQTVDAMPATQGKPFVPPHVTGKNGGHTISLHQFARDGIALLGHLVGAGDNKIALAPDLPANLAKADQFEADLVKNIDAYIEQNGLDAPPERLPSARDGYSVPVVQELDLNKEGITSIVWAAGYRPDFSLVKLPILSPVGLPLARMGVTAHPGLYFVGVPWQPGLGSAFLIRVGRAAAYVASQIAAGHGLPEDR